MDFVRKELEAPWDRPKWSVLQPYQPQQPMGVSENGGTPKSSILIGFSILNHPFWGTPIFGNTHMAYMVSPCFTDLHYSLKWLAGDYMARGASLLLCRVSWCGLGAHGSL